MWARGVVWLCRRHQRRGVNINRGFKYGVYFEIFLGRINKSESKAGVNNNNNNNKSVMLKIYAATTTRYVGSTLPLEVRALKLLECQWHVCRVHMFQYHN